jgi:hypothetical protein
MARRLARGKLCGLFGLGQHARMFVTIKNTES